MSSGVFLEGPADGVFQSVDEVGELGESGENGEQQTCAQNQEHGRRTPDDAVEPFVGGFDPGDKRFHWVPP